MPDPLEYCNAEAQYLMLLSRHFSSKKISFRVPITRQEIQDQMRAINKQLPAMLSGTGEKKVLEAFYSFWNQGVKYGEEYFRLTEHSNG